MDKNWQRCCHNNTRTTDELVLLFHELLMPMTWLLRTSVTCSNFSLPAPSYCARIMQASSSSSSSSNDGVRRLAGLAPWRETLTSFIFSITGEGVTLQISSSGWPPAVSGHSDRHTTFSIDSVTTRRKIYSATYEWHFSCCRLDFDQHPAVSVRTIDFYRH